MIIRDKIREEEWREILKQYPSMIKLVVDIKKEVLAIGCELHIDCMDELLDDGSDPKMIWGANIYPDKSIDFVSLINIRPAANNRSMKIEDVEIQKKIESVIRKLL